MTAFLTGTLVWTGVLIALVLLVRRPVARVLGAKAAYGLWALPMARLLLPPLVLPAWMAPEPEPIMTADLAGESAFVAVEPVAFPTTFAPVEEPAIDWLPILLALWLAGAMVFLVRRYALYFRMRRELLTGARAVGEAGRVRLVETPEADGPVAFGVLDKVIALPPGFMASRDRQARDLALAHELAHHRGHDLLCNMLVQPLFALHWFNPLAALGWRALRRDQEAACDARVMNNQPRERRAAYAAVIARFATQQQHSPRLALAAPMACPVLGDRSIVQRLRSLAMSDVSKRRRWSGRLLTAAAVLALPLTGSISYAQSDVPPPPPAAEAPPAPPAPPAPVTAVAPPAPPAPPVPPIATTTTVTKDGKKRIVRIERRIENGDHEDRADHGDKHTERRVIIRNGREMTAEERAELEKDMAELRKELGPHGELQRELRRELGPNGELERELRKEFGENGKFRREMHLAIAEARHAAPQVKVACRQGQREVTETVIEKNGRESLFVCNAVAMAEARKAIALARTEIARSHDLSARERAEALRSLDEAERSSRAD